MFSYVRADKRVPSDHPLRAIRAIVDAALSDLSPAFGSDPLRRRDSAASLGRPSIPPERLLRALLLQAFYTVRSERLSMDDAVWDPTVFSKNRDRLLDGDIARKFLGAVLSQPRVRGLFRPPPPVDHADRGLGEPEELPAEGRQRHAADRRWAQRGAGFPRREALERHACFHHRPGRAPVPQGAGHVCRIGCLPVSI
jgi:transposase